MTKDDFAALVDQALDEIDDLAAAIDFDEEFMLPVQPLIEPIKSELMSIKKNIQADNLEITRDDFKFAALIQPVPSAILPFKTLLERINNAEIIE